jgi:AraC-like DNA-binding protein
LADIMPSEIAFDWTSRVLALIAARLGHRSIGLDDIAIDLSIAPRSLQRRLAEEGTSLRQILSDHRKQVAELHLRAGEPHLGKLAVALGYADGTTFWRAHRGWKGVPPSAARSRRR